MLRCRDVIHLSPEYIVATVVNGHSPGRVRFAFCGHDFDFAVCSAHARTYAQGRENSIPHHQKQRTRNRPSDVHVAGCIQHLNNIAHQQSTQQNRRAFGITLSLLAIRLNTTE